MKNLSLEQITKLEEMSKDELITSFNQYSAYVDNNLNLLVNVSTIDKSIYVAIMAKSMKQVEIVKETNLTKSHISRMNKVGSWILANREQYTKLVATAGTKLNLRVMSDGIAHNTIKGVDDWASLVENEKSYKASTKATPAEPATKQAKPSSDKAKATPKTTPAPKHAFKIVDFERMNSTSMYSAIIRMVDAYKASGDNLEYMNNFISRLNELKH